MGYKFTYAELEAMANDIKANADMQLKAIANLQGAVKALVGSEKFTGETASSVKSYYTNVYGAVIPIMSLIITNHAKNCLLYIKAYANADLGGDTAVSVDEVQEIQKGLRFDKFKAGAINASDNAKRTNGEFVEAMGCSVGDATSRYSTISSARDAINELISNMIQDINTIESAYKKSNKFGSEFTGARVGLKNLDALLNQRIHGGVRVTDYDINQFWNTPEGKKLKLATIDLWYENYCKKGDYEDTPVSEHEYDGMVPFFDKRTNGDDLYNNKYYQDPLNGFPVNWEGGGGNCTWYAWGRYLESQGIDVRPADLDMNGNAEDWYAYAQNNGYDTGQEPMPGAIMVWKYTNDRWGHVAFVEDVDDDGTVHTSESGWRGGKFWTKTYDKHGTADGRVFLGYIYPRNNSPLRMNDSDRAFLKDLKDGDSSYANTSELKKKTTHTSSHKSSTSGSTSKPKSSSSGSTSKPKTSTSGEKAGPPKPKTSTSGEKAGPPKPSGKSSSSSGSSHSSGSSSNGSHSSGSSSSGSSSSGSHSSGGSSSGSHSSGGSSNSSGSHSSGSHSNSGSSHSSGGSSSDKSSSSHGGSSSGGKSGSSHGGSSSGGKSGSSHGGSSSGGKSDSSHGGSSSGGKSGSSHNGGSSHSSNSGSGSNSSHNGGASHHSTNDTNQNANNQNTVTQNNASQQSQQVTHGFEESTEKPIVHDIQEDVKPAETGSEIGVELNKPINSVESNVGVTDVNTPDADINSGTEMNADSLDVVSGTEMNTIGPDATSGTETGVIDSVDMSASNVDATNLGVDMNVDGSSTTSGVEDSIASNADMTESTYNLL